MPYREDLGVEEAAARTQRLVVEAQRLERRRVLRSAAGSASVIGLLSAPLLSYLVLSQQGWMHSIPPLVIELAYFAAQVVMPLLVTLVVLEIKRRLQESAARHMNAQVRMASDPWQELKATLQRVRNRREDGVLSLAVGLLYVVPIGWVLTLQGGAALVLAVGLAWAWVPLFFWIVSARAVFGEKGCGLSSVLALAFILFLVMPLAGLVAHEYGERPILTYFALGFGLPILLRFAFARLLTVEDRALATLQEAVALEEVDRPPVSAR